LLANEPGLRRKYETSDLVQETLIHAQGSFDQCQGSKEEERLAWLIGILKHRLGDMRRWYGASKRAVVREQSHLSEKGLGNIINNIPDDDPTPSSHCRRKETDEELRSALAHIQLPDRDVLLWKAQDDWTFEQIAQALSCTVRQVRHIHQRALVRLQRLLSLRIV
jgi:RNA polymerase sigma-70 factor, ECF subfamily